MAILGTFNGASIVAFPAFPGIRQIEMVASDAVAVSISPYTGQQQTQFWPGGDLWTASISLPQMTAVNAAAWSAFLLELRGMKNVFQVGHPQKRVPQGLGAGVPLVDGAQGAMSPTLNTRGWKVSTVGLLLPGDHIQIGYRLHVVLDRVDSDVNGKSAISVWPSLREATADGVTVQLSKPQGMWRLAENKRSITTAQTQLSAVQVIKCMEAR